jgi:hypothetical protein
LAKHSCGVLVKSLRRVHLCKQHLMPTALRSQVNLMVSRSSSILVQARD